MDKRYADNVFEINNQIGDVLDCAIFGHDPFMSKIENEIENEFIINGVKKFAKPILIKYINNEEKTPILLLNKINKCLKETQFSVINIILLTLYYLLCKNFVRKTIEYQTYVFNYDNYTNKYNQIEKLDGDIKNFFDKIVKDKEENSKIIQKLEEKIIENKKKINEYEEFNLNIGKEKNRNEENVKIIKEYKEKIEKLQVKLYNKEVLMNDLRMFKEELLDEIKNIDSELLDTRKNLNKKINKYNIIKKELKEIQNENKIIKDKMLKIDLEFDYNKYEKIIKKFDKKENRNKLWMEVIKKHNNIHGKKDNKVDKFFEYKLNNSIKNKLKRKYNFGDEEIDIISNIKYKEETEPVLKKILLKLLRTITKNTSSKASLWYRHFIQKQNVNKNTDVYTRFYYTYINPFNDEEKIKYDEYMKMDSVERRKLFFKEYEQFDSESHNQISLYDKDSDKTIKKAKYQYDLNNFYEKDDYPKLNNYITEL